FLLLSLLLSSLFVFSLLCSASRRPTLVPVVLDSLRHQIGHLVQSWTELGVEVVQPEFCNCPQTGLGQNGEAPRTLLTAGSDELCRVREICHLHDDVSRKVLETRLARPHALRVLAHRRGEIEQDISVHSGISEYHWRPQSV
ncbi:hypothetical protein PFISCL1PPCAC_25351, partial [Pristionchus fissidentatus]